MTKVKNRTRLDRHRCCRKVYGVLAGMRPARRKWKETAMTDKKFLRMLENRKYHCGKQNHRDCISGDGLCTPLVITMMHKAYKKGLRKGRRRRITCCWSLLDGRAWQSECGWVETDAALCYRYCPRCGRRIKRKN